MNQSPVAFANCLSSRASDAGGDATTPLRRRASARAGRRRTRRAVFARESRRRSEEKVVARRTRRVLRGARLPHSASQLRGEASARASAGGGRRNAKRRRRRWRSRRSRPRGRTTRSTVRLRPPPRDPVARLEPAMSIGDPSKNSVADLFALSRPRPPSRRPARVHGVRREGSLPRADARRGGDAAARAGVRHDVQRGGVAPFAHVQVRARLDATRRDATRRDALILDPPSSPTSPPPPADRARALHPAGSRARTWCRRTSTASSDRRTAERRARGARISTRR